MQIHSSWTLGVSSDLMDFGPTMDGERFIGETYFVVVSTLDGTFIHGARFDGARQALDEEGWVFYRDLRQEAIAEANALADKIKAKGEIDPYYWEFRPHYSKGGADLLWKEEMLDKASAIAV